MNADRDAEICQRYTNGEGTTRIAGDLKLTSERVRQILRAAGLWERGGRTKDRTKAVREASRIGNGEAA